MEKRLHALIDIAALKLAAHDFRYLLNRNYPRRTALVGTFRLQTIWPFQVGGVGYLTGRPLWYKGR